MHIQLYACMYVCTYINIHAHEYLGIITTHNGSHSHLLSTVICALYSPYVVCAGYIYILPSFGNGLSPCGLTGSLTRHACRNAG